jgi:hypothetical protein
MSTQKREPTSQPKPTAPGKPASRQPPDANTGKPKKREEGQDIPKTGRASSAERDRLNGSSPEGNQ